MTTSPRIHRVKSNLKYKYFKSCKNCTDRVVGCHSKCERYISEKKDYEAACDAIMTQLKEEACVEETVVMGRIRTIRRNGGK